MKCERCGTFLMDGTDFCTSCGAPTAHGKFADQEPPVFPSGPPAEGTPQHVEEGPRTSKRSSEGNGILPLVAFAIVFAIVIVFLIWLMGSPWGGVEPEEDKTTLRLDPDVRNSTVAGEGHWDVVISIDKVSPLGDKVEWAHTRLMIEASGGGELHGRAALEQDDLTAYDDGTDGTVTVQFWYVDMVRGDVYIDAGDGIKVTGITEEYKGANVTVFHKGEMVGEVRIPPDFP